MTTTKPTADYTATMNRRTFCPSCTGRLIHLRGNLRCACCGLHASTTGDDVTDHPQGEH